ncbi:ArsR family transcriptional regulator [Lentzea sp. NPDC092896]|uniref:arsenate reductase/protein-tyrosine-phosphatase family protein n=1 Tax=Lentzea sp. NPDC092896 TaxID=3364127 RepID=UPI00383095F4
MPTDRPVSSPPPLLGLAGEALRWGLLRELARSDRRVGELVAAVGQPQSLVSYHLRKLRTGEMVTARRSSADGRDTYYSLDLARCTALLTETASALHPGLRLGPAQTTTVDTTGRVLFLCTGNSARSQMAEALLAARAGRIEVFSAGSRPKPVHPNAVAVMHDHGVDLSGCRSKHLSEFTGQRFDYVISLCDRVREVCPEFPGGAELAHWSMPDPSAEGTLPAFERTAAELTVRIGHLLQTMAHDHEREVPEP